MSKGAWRVRLICMMRSGAARESSGRENVLNNVQQIRRVAGGTKRQLSVAMFPANKIYKRCQLEGKLHTARLLIALK